MRYHRTTVAATLHCVSLLLVQLHYALALESCRTTTLTVMSTATATLSEHIIADFDNSVVEATTTVIGAESTVVVTTVLAPSSASGAASGTAAAPAASGSMGYAGATFRAAILNSTNVYRAQHQAGPVGWNATLAEFALAWAQRCVWEHSGGPYGENLALNFATPTEAVDAWAAEEADYDYLRPGFAESTGHFTQLVWKATTTVGCGAVACANSAHPNGAQGWFLVCEYSPRGNVIGSFGENVGKPGLSADGVPGFGGSASGVAEGRGRKRLGALVAAYLLLAWMT